MLTSAGFRSRQKCKFLELKKLLKLQRKKVGEDERKCETNGISFGFFYFPVANQLYM